MSWYYADNGRQVGPIEESALDDLVRSGAVKEDTLVWREGMPNWQPHDAARGLRPPPPSVSPASTAAVAIPAEAAFCTECGRSFSAQQLSSMGAGASVCADCKAGYLQRTQVAQLAGTRRYAGFWIRFLAVVIDGLILAVLNSIVTFPFRVTTAFRVLTGEDPGAVLGAIAGIFGLSLFIGMALTLVYNVYFVARNGATPGKMILGLKIIRADGGPVSVARATGRYFAWILSAMIFYIGFIIAGFDSEKRALHDHLAETRVIHAR